MEQLKIKWIYYILIKLGLKTLELRAFEDIGDGGEFILISLNGKKKYGKIRLSLYAFDDSEELPLGWVANTNEGLRPISLQNTWFWRPWVKFYLDKRETPAFYLIVNFDFEAKI